MIIFDQHQQAKHVGVPTFLAEKKYKHTFMHVYYVCLDFIYTPRTTAISRLFPTSSGFCSGSQFHLFVSHFGAPQLRRSGMGQWNHSIPRCRTCRGMSWAENAWAKSMAVSLHVGATQICWAFPKLTLLAAVGLPLFMNATEWWLKAFTLGVQSREDLAFNHANCFFTHSGFFKNTLQHTTGQHLLIYTWKSKAG